MKLDFDELSPEEIQLVLLEEIESEDKLNYLAKTYSKQSNYSIKEKKLIFQNTLQASNKLSNLGKIYYDKEEYSKALPLFNRALDIKKLHLKNSFNSYKKRFNNYPPPPPYFILIHVIYEFFCAIFYIMSYVFNIEKNFMFFSKFSSQAFVSMRYLDVASSLNSLAALHFIMGDYIEAQKSHQIALAIRETHIIADNKPDNINELIQSLENLARIYCYRGYFFRAEPLYQRAFYLSKKQILWKEHRATSLSALADFYEDLGEYSKAEPLFHHTLSICLGSYGEKSIYTANAYCDKARLYCNMRKYTESRFLYKRALVIYEEKLGKEHPNISPILIGLSHFYNHKKLFKKAISLASRALEIKEKKFGKNNLHTSYIIQHLGYFYYKEGVYTLAEELYERVLIINEKHFGLELGIVGILKNYADLLQAKNNVEGAIFFAKRATNILQKNRNKNRKLTKNLKESFLKKHKDTYRTLSEWLVDAGRLVEAEHVIEMLKEEETFSYIRRDRSRDGISSNKTIGYTPQEQPWQQRYEEISTQLIVKNEEFRQLQELGDQRSETEEQRYEQLEKDMDIAEQHLATFCEDIRKASFKRKRRDALAQKNLLEMEYSEQLQGTLENLERIAGKGVVVLHYLVREEKISAWLTTSNIRKALTISVSAKNLRRKIHNYRQTLQQRDSLDAFAQALYQDLIAPFESDLQQAKAHTLMLSLDDALRYIPIAALHDGNRYLAERYKLCIYTAALGGHNLTEKPKAQWQVAGMGVNEAVRLTTDYDIVEEHDFKALSYVTDELEGIIFDQEQKTRGVLSGKICINDCFTKTQFKNILGQRRHSVLHLATHFSLKPGAEANSFLLLGQQQTLSLRELNTGFVFNFKHLDLLTLSACNTAMSDEHGYLDKIGGSEIESFANLAQKKGANAVMASLWAVNDRSTSHLMKEFYRLREEEGLNKVQSLKKAQQLLIDHPRWNHPYYWSGFILMGNWL